MQQNVLKRIGKARHQPEIFKIKDMSENSLVADAYNSTFKPENIILTYESAYSNNTQISFAELQSFFKTKMHQGIIYSTRIGAAAVAILILWMVTKNRKSPIFIINQFSLLLVVLHSALFIKFLLSSYSSIVYTFTYFPQSVTRSDIYITGAVDMLEVILVASVEISLVFQVYTIFKSSNNRFLSYSWISLSSALGLSTIGVYFATAVISIKDVYKSSSQSSDSKLFNVGTILFASSINVMTLLLSLKLIYAIRARRFLGLKQFDTFHILLIMSSQSLIVPSILFILSYALPTKYAISNLGAIATLIVVLSLPLSSMWASASNNSSQINTFNPNTDLKLGDNSSFYSQTIQSAIQAKRSARKNLWGNSVEFSPDSEETAKDTDSKYFKADAASDTQSGFVQQDDQQTIDDENFWLNHKSMISESQMDASGLDFPVDALCQLRNNERDDDIVHSKIISKK